MYSGLSNVGLNKWTTPPFHMIEREDKQTQGDDIKSRRSWVTVFDFRPARVSGTSLRRGRCYAERIDETKGGKRRRTALSAATHLHSHPDLVAHHSIR